MNRPEIAVRDLHKSFGDNHVLRGIDLEIGRGEVVCVIGPSGSGKSTLLRCVNLLEEPSRGQVFVGGTELTDPDVDIDVVVTRWGTTSLDVGFTGTIGERALFRATVTYVGVEPGTTTPVPPPDEVRSLLGEPRPGVR